VRKRLSVLVLAIFAFAQTLYLGNYEFRYLSSRTGVNREIHYYYTLGERLTFDSVSQIGFDLNNYFDEGRLAGVSFFYVPVSGSRGFTILTLQFWLQKDGGFLVE